jgi:arylsulfatase A-like enzyme
MEKLTKNPNIILVYTDQQRYDTLGINGNPYIRTPNLDNFAKEGVHFTNCHVTTPLCVPSRVGLFTGRYNHTNLSYNNFRFMNAKEIDFVSLLKKNRYTTALIGKNHCFPPKRLQDTFDYLYLASHFGKVPPREEIEKEIFALRKDNILVPFAEDPIPHNENITAGLFRNACNYITEHLDENFFLWLSIPDPHPPYMVCEPYASMYNEVDIPLPQWSENEMVNKPYRQQIIREWDLYSKFYPDNQIKKLIKIYWGMISYIDTEFGKLIKKMSNLGLDENTIIIFTSDHGDYMGEHHFIRKGPLLYNSLTHVPLIIKWPNHFPARSTNALVANIDIFPSIFKIFRCSFPKQVQGLSFARVLNGSRDAHRNMIFMENGSPGAVVKKDTLSVRKFERLRNSNGHLFSRAIWKGRVKGVRSNDWMYCITPGDVDELYDLKSDPYEIYNLANDPEYSKIALEHKEQILKWLIDTEDIAESDSLIRKFSENSGDFVKFSDF